jgi:uncharacterized protein (DUF1015 family)
MISVIPFKAVRPSRDKANLVASRPFYNYKKHILSAKLEGNPYTFLHVINPEFKTDDKTKPNTRARFEKVKVKYEEFKANKILIQDEKPCLYVYRQTTPTDTYIGIIAGATAQDYIDGNIKIHEHTLTEREETFCKYIDVCKFNAEPVLLTYKDNPLINSLIEKYTKERSEYEFSTTDLIKHDLWVISDHKDIDLVQLLFKDIPAAYIADGHHRTASSVLYATENKEIKATQYFLSFFIAESSLKIYDFNRTVKGLNGLSTDEFLNAVKKYCILSNSSKKKLKPSALHEFSMYIEGLWYLLKVRSEFVDEYSPVGSLDPQILSDTILSNVLGVKDLKNDKRVQFIDGTQGMKALKKSVDTKKSDVAFAVYPISIEQLKLIADTNNVMPPKSTWIEPKLRSGLTIYEF